ncbi:aspartyl/asparaginyl beta-hydroxylase domain-containing protein [Nocardia sp. 2]|uniref:Aspartyl/asparaginyl beta-hydroxylase domain-containing protein n=1 Tax=Nocardia acididurans TaxID=2802282 RepID=A0ABS1MI99_9NOCA|nr:aspartyl/asparaginyl beta-hydroxylase domain-containing protein [Nocardia acididurans]MBL1080291.1 aspartyl/asparaginyl beta-hydroxylase domain-containing protein [Nocardia acididurans]
MNLLPLLGKISVWFSRTAGGDSRPAFYDIDQTYPALRVIDAAYPAIKREAEKVLGENVDLPQYHDLDPGQTAISATTPRKWKVYYLWSMGKWAEPNATRCPETAAVLAQVPNLFQAFFSILEPGKSVPPHRGYAGYLRYHIGLVVPKVDPPSIRVRDEWHTWQEGQSVLFDDSWEHEVKNNSNGDRVVLIVDVLRPMPMLQNIVNMAISYAGRITYRRNVMSKVADFANHR